MKPTTRLLLSVVAGVVALVLMGAYAMSLASAYSSARDKAMKKYGGDIVEVLVAKTDIKVNGSLTAENTEKRKWVADLLPAGAITSLKQTKGKKVNSIILAGEPIVEARVGVSDVTDLSVPKGLTAVSVPVQDVFAVGGAIRAGDKVDVYANADDGPFVLAEKVFVLATSADGARAAAAADGGTFGDEAGLSWVTLAVDPSLVRPVIRWSDASSLHLVINGDGSRAAASADSTTAP